MKQQRSTLFDKLIPILVKPRKFLINRTSNDLSVETIRYSERNWGKSGMKFIVFTTKVSKIRSFHYFRQHSPYYGSFPKLSQSELP